MGKWLVFATLTLLTGIVAVGQAQAGHVSCGDTLTTNTTLDGNLNCATAPGLVIGADGITLDCAEFKIEGPGTATPCCPTPDRGIELSGRTGVTVTNCRVKNFGAGFQIGRSSFNTFTNNRASNNGVGFNGVGFFLFGGSHNNTLTNNRANENVFGFILSGVGGAPNNTLTDNRANENTSHGFVVENSPNNTLTGNRANKNGVLGFVVYLPSSVGNTLAGNRANENGGDGFNLHRFASNNALTNNRANENGPVGFRIGFPADPVSNNTLTTNEACENGLVDALQGPGSINNTFTGNEFCTTSGI